MLQNFIILNLFQSGSIIFISKSIKIIEFINSVDKLYCNFG